MRKYIVQLIHIKTVLNDSWVIICLTYDLHQGPFTSSVDIDT